VRVQYDAVKQENQVAQTPAKPARKRAPSSQKNAKAKRTVEHEEIAKRAYFIYVDEGRTDQVSNWLRAERELAVA
jgi:hypothetical protein